MNKETRNDLRDELKEGVKNIINESKEEINIGVDNIKKDFKNLEQFEDVKYFNIIEYSFNNIVGAIGGFMMLFLIGEFILNKIPSLYFIVNPFLACSGVAILILLVSNIVKFISNYKYIKQLRNTDEMIKGKLFVFIKNGLSLLITIIILLFAAKDEIMMNLEYGINKAYNDGGVRALQEQGIDYIIDEQTYEEFKESKQQEEITNINNNISLIYGEWQEPATESNLIIVDKLFNSCPFEILNEESNLYTLLIHTYEGDAKVNVKYDELKDSIIVSYYNEETDSYFGCDIYYRKK